MSLLSMRYESASISHWLVSSTFSYKASSTTLFFFIQFQFQIDFFCYTMNLFYLFSATLVVLLISSSQAHTPGTVTVDTFTFDKIIRNFDIVLAKFDDKYRTYDFFLTKKLCLKLFFSLW